MSKNLFVSIAVCAAFMLGGANAAFAGEVTGTGVSLKPLNGKSACAFSGLEDGNVESAGGPGIVQSFGKHPFDTVGNDGVSDNPDNIPNHQGPAAPGIACNPSDPQNPS